MSAKVARIERSIASLEEKIAFLEGIPSKDPESEYTRVGAIARLKGNLRRAEESLRITRLLEAPRVDPSQTDLEREVDAESRAHGPELGGSKKRGR